MAIDLNKLREKYKQISEKETKTESTSENYLKIAEGSNMIRILPPKDEGPFFTEVHEHRFKFNNTIHYITCPKTHNDTCPICDTVYKLWDKHNDLKLGKGAKSPFGSLAGSIKGRPRYYLNVYSRKEEAVKIYSAPEQVFKLIMIGILGNDELGIDPLGDVTDLEKGYDFNLISTKKGDWPSFEQSRFRPSATALAPSKAKIAEIMDARHDLSALAKKEDYEKLKLLAESLLLGETATKPEEGTVEKSAPVSDEEYAKKLNSKS